MLCLCLAHGVRCALVPTRSFWRLLGREYFHKVRGEIVELIARVNMTIQRGAVELRQNVDRPESGIQTVTDRYIDQSIFAGQRHRRFCAILGQGKQACPRTTAHDDGERSVLEGRFIYS